MSALETYLAAARDLVDVERKIANLTRWKQPAEGSINARVLASLKAKRARDIATVADLKLKAQASSEKLRDRFGDRIDFKAPTWQPIGSVAIEDVAGPMPDFLRRS
jgi:hypothetical protein